LQSQAIAMKRMVEQNHIAPRAVDVQFSADLLDQFITDLDPDKLYFTQIDIDGVNKHRAILNDELHNKSWSFFPNL
jgi:carboxyl-terminal processing protease